MPKYLTRCKIKQGFKVEKFLLPKLRKRAMKKETIYDTVLVGPWGPEGPTK